MKKDTTTLIVGNDSSDTRLDRFLVAQGFVDDYGIPFSRGALRRAVDGGQIRVNDQIVKPHLAVRSGDHITIAPEVFVVRTALVPDASLQCAVVYEHTQFLIVNKPAGFLVHPVDFESKEKTLAHGLIARYPEIIGVGEDALRPGIVHRLDRDTSGVMIIARTQHAFEFFKEAFARRLIHKTYYAIVHGCPRELSDIIDFPIARSVRSDRWLALRTDRDPYKGRVRTARTEYKVLCVGDTMSILCAKPHTGRTHQIRVHFQALGCPLVGDTVYKQRGTQSSSMARQALHSSVIEFTYEGHKWVFGVPVPQDMQELWHKICPKVNGSM